MDWVSGLGRDFGRLTGEYSSVSVGVLADAGLGGMVGASDNGKGGRYAA